MHPPAKGLTSGQVDGHRPRLVVLAEVVGQLSWRAVDQVARRVKEGKDVGSVIGPRKGDRGGRCEGGLVVCVARPRVTTADGEVRIRADHVAGTTGQEGLCL